jgi:hypothetical protein
VGLLACGGLLAGGLVAAALFEPRLPTALRPSTTPAAPAPTTVPTTEPRPAGASRDQPAPIGTDVVPAKGWTVRVTKADLDADAEMRRAQWWMRPGQGERYVLLTLDVGHQAEQKAVPSFEMKFAMVTAKGTEHWPMVYNPTPGSFAIGQEWPPQGSRSGTVAFELPRAEIPGAVLRIEPTVTLDQAKDRRYLALS